MTDRVSREAVLWHRAAAQELDRATSSAAELAVTALGVQDTPPGSAAAAFAARLPGPPGLDGLAATWTHRGAPHRHRPADLPWLAAALWPRSAKDAKVRLAGSGPALERAGVDGRDAIAATSRALREVAHAPMPKGELSAAVTEALPGEYSRWCEPCGSTHVWESLFRLAVLPAGLLIEPGRTPLTFRPAGTPVDPPAAPVDTVGLVGRYLAVLGPATPAAIAAFLGTSAAEGRALWPAGLTEIEVDGRAMWIDEPGRAALLAAERPEGVRLLPPSDPFLQDRDREMLVPDPAHRRELWRTLSRRGALLDHGEITGFWRTKTAGKRFEVIVTPFASAPPARTRTAIEDEAAALAAARGMSSVSVGYA